MSSTNYWIMIIEFIKNCCKSVKIPWNVDEDGCLIFGNSKIKFIDGNDNCFVDAKYFITTPINEEIEVETTLLCGPEGESKIITTKKIIYVGDLNDNQETLRVNASKVADKNIQQLIEKGGVIDNLPSSISRITPSLGNYSLLVRQLGDKQSLMFLLSRGPPFFYCNRVLMQRCFPDATIEYLKTLSQNLSSKTQMLIKNWTIHVNNDDFEYLIILACVLVGEWPYIQEEIQDPSFTWGLCWSPAEPNGLQKTIKPTLIKRKIYGSQCENAFVDNLNKRASAIFGENNKLSPTFYDLYGLFMAMGAKKESKEFQKLSIEFADFTRNDLHIEEKKPMCSFYTIAVAVVSVAAILKIFF